MATTENPQEILLKTAAAGGLNYRCGCRIWIIARQQKKRELILSLLQKEQAKLGCSVLISDLAYHTLETAHFPGMLVSLKTR